MNIITNLIKSYFKTLLINKMKSNQDKIVTNILFALKNKVPMSGELEEHLITELYDSIEIVVSEQIDLIGKDKEK